MDKQNKIIISVTVVIILVIVFFGFYKNTDNNSGLTLIEKDTFAKCLSDSGLTMYGAEWCSHCKDQKNLFGSSFKYINYVECPDKTDFCLAKGIQGYPTWILESSTSTTPNSTSTSKNILLEGLQSFQKLSEVSGCNLATEVESK